MILTKTGVKFTFSWEEALQAARIKRLEQYMELKQKMEEEANRD